MKSWKLQERNILVGCEGIAGDVGKEYQFGNNIMRKLLLSTRILEAMLMSMIWRLFSFCKRVEICGN